MSISVRNSEMKDLSSFVELFNQIEQLHREGDPSRYREPPSTFPAEHFKKILADTTMKMFIAEKEGKVAGYVMLLIKETNHPILVTEKFVHIEQIAVAEAFQRQGVGAQLMASVEAFAKSNGYSKVELGVMSFNLSALEFYETLGYVPIRSVLAKQII